MRKVLALFAVLMAFSLYFSASPALAHPQHTDRVNNESEEENEDEDRGRSDREKTDRMHRELDDRFEDVSRVIVPPLGLIPQEDPNIQVLPEQPVVKLSELPDLSQLTTSLDQTSANQAPVYLVLGPGQQAPSATSQNANKYAPIQIKDLVQSGDGPATDFMRSAMILLAVLAVIAAILLGVVSKSALRLKKRPREI